MMYQKHLITFLAVTIITLARGTEADNCNCRRLHPTIPFCSFLGHLNTVAVSNQRELLKWNDYISFVSKFSQNWREEISRVVAERLPQEIKDLKEDSRKMEEKLKIEISNLEDKLLKVETRTVKLENELAKEQDIRKEFEKVNISNLEDKLLKEETRTLNLENELAKEQGIRKELQVRMEKLTGKVNISNLEDKLLKAETRSLKLENELAKEQGILEDLQLTIRETRSTQSALSRRVRNLSSTVNKLVKFWLPHNSSVGQVLNESLNDFTKQLKEDVRMLKSSALEKNRRLVILEEDVRSTNASLKRVLSELEILRNPCSIYPCRNGGTCKIEGNAATCSCRPGFSGEFCENVPCSTNPCRNGGTCKREGDAAKCCCHRGFSGEFCESRAFKFHFGQAAGRCFVIQHEEPSDNVTYFDTREDCERVSLNLDGQGVFKFHLDEGACGCFSVRHEGSSDNKTYFDTKDMCERMSPKPDAQGPCSTHPCINGGTCRAESHAAQCCCLPGFEGEYCEKRAVKFYYSRVSNRCFRIWTERPTDNVHAFNTAEECERLSVYPDLQDACLINPCRNGGTCKIRDDDRICSCGRHFSGRFCENRVFQYFYDKNFRRCFSVTHDGSNDNVTLFDTEDDCVRLSLNPEDPCSVNPCRNGGTCITVGDAAKCSCRRGFLGNYCENRESIKFFYNEGMQRCFGSELSYRTDNLTLFDTENECIRMSVNPDGQDHCSINTCRNGGTCKTEDHVVKCSCVHRFSGEFCDNAVFKFYFAEGVSACFGKPYVFNENNPLFEAEEDCKIVYDVPPLQEACLLPKATIPCAGRKTTVWYFDVYSRTCKSYMYGSCQSLYNRFQSKRDCERLCTNFVLAPSTWWT